MRRILHTFFILYLAMLPANAEQLNFNDFLSTALNNSYKVKIAEINKNITQRGVKEARAAYFPTISAFATTERYNDLTNGGAPLTAVGNEIFLNRDYYQDMAAVGLSYNLFDFGVRKRQLDIAKADNKQKEILLKKNTRDLKLDIVELYAQTLALYKQSQIKNDELNLRDELREINKKLRLAGEISEIDVVDSEIKASETKSELDEIKNRFAKKLTEISFYTNKTYDIKDIELTNFPLDVNNIPTEVDPFVKLSAQVNNLIVENSVESKVYDLEILKKQKEYEIQKKYNFPKIRFDTRYNLYGSDTNNFFDGIGDISQRSLSFRLSTSFVLFDGFKNINTVAKSKMEVEKLKVEKEEQLAELRKKYEQVQLDSKNALIQSENNEKTLALVNKNLQMLENLNANGIIEKSACIKKQLELLDKKMKLEQTQINIFVTQYKLQVLSDEKVEL
mgnify:CR=1 FL=1